MLKYFLKSCVVILLSLLLVSNCWAGMDFDNVDDDLPLVSDTTMGSIEGGPLTISAWIYPDATPAGDSNAQGRIVGKGGTGYTAFQYDDRVTEFNCLSFVKNYATTDLNRISGDDTITKNVWTHTLVTWDGGATATNIHIYINGTETTYQTTINGVGAEQSAGTGIWHIGNNATPGVRDFPGIITEVAVWNTELSTSQIALLANSRIKSMPLQIATANLKGYWSMDDQEAGTAANGDTVRDLSGNGNNGTADDGANNTGCTWTGESILSYPPPIGNWQ